jgi:hypothetical protein
MSQSPALISGAFFFAPVPDRVKANQLTVIVPFMSKLYSQWYAILPGLFA